VILLSSDTQDYGRFDAFMEEAARLATDQTASEDARRWAVAVLAHADIQQAGKLISLTGEETAQPLQIAAVRSLSQPHFPKLAARLFDASRWKTHSPAVRAVILAAALARAELIPGLLDAVEAGTVSTSVLDSAQRSQLLKHRDTAIRARAEKLFQQVTSGDRMKAFEDWKAVLALKPDAAHGREVFVRTCANCHRLDRVGSAVGPDLFGIRNQPKEAILLHIIVPEYEIMPGFANYVIETKDGRTLNGLIASETGAGVTLRRALGEEEVILRRDITSMSASNLSLMPQEIEKTMTRQEMADLLAYLKGEATGR
jgi:putative heme-binding domain-containing protein